MAGRLIGAWNPALDATGVAISGAKLYTYSPGTTTPKATYTDSGLGTPHLNPVVADSAGRFAEIWGADDASYDLKWTDASGVQIVLFEDIQVLGATSDSGAIMRDFGADGRLNIEARGGTAYLEAGDASPDNSGGKLRLGGWEGTQADTVIIDADATSTTGDVTVGGDLAVSGVVSGRSEKKISTGSISGTSFWVSLGGLGPSRFRLAIDGLTMASAGQITVQLSTDNQATTVTGTLGHLSHNWEDASDTVTSNAGSGNNWPLLTSTDVKAAGSFFLRADASQVSAKGFIISVDMIYTRNGTNAQGRVLSHCFNTSTTTVTDIKFNLPSSASAGTWTLYHAE